MASTEIDVERAGEQQEGEHALHERAVEIDAPEKPAHRMARREAGNKRIGRHHRERGERAHDGQPDGVRQLDERVVHVAEDRGEHDQYGGGVDRVKGGLFHDGRDLRQAWFAARLGSGTQV
jgi:hypothetical protein